MRTYAQQPINPLYNDTHTRCTPTLNKTGGQTRYDLENSKKFTPLPNCRDATYQPQLMVISLDKVTAFKKLTCPTPVKLLKLNKVTTVALPTILFRVIKGNRHRLQIATATFGDERGQPCIKKKSSREATQFF